jgi:hypothetical protein
MGISVSTARVMLLTSAAVAGGLVVVACGSTRGGGFGVPNLFEDGGVGADGGPELALPDTGLPPAPPPPLGYVTGVVLAPEGTIPLSEALVYLTSTAPAPIPDGVYCDKCVQLDSYAYTYSKADGTFKLPIYETGKQYVVTQKGQFRRVRNFDVQVGATWPKALTQLPGRNETTLGDHVPKMLVMPNQWDAIDDSLKKLGITEFENLNAQINPLDLTAVAARDKRANLVWSSVAEMSKYKYVFLPCSGSSRDDSDGGPTCDVAAQADKAKGRVLVDYVRAGGRLYTTDWSYEYVRQNWKGAITWKGERSLTDIGYACGSTTPFNSPATFDDPPLRDWMNATNSQNAQLTEMYASIDKVNSFVAENENGVPTAQTPKVWVSQTAQGAARPATVSFQDRCGRVLYSTYHAEGNSGRTLIAQEKALLHVLLEVGVCLGTRPPVIAN